MRFRMLAGAFALASLTLATGCLLDETIGEGMDPELDALESSFNADCKHSHMAPDDPIVFPGQPGAAHMHSFFGNRSTTAFSNYASMVGQATTCEQAGETAGYWVPTLYNQSGQAITLRNVVVYYRDAPQADKAVTPFPPDFKLIAGYPTPHVNSPRGWGNWGWDCGGDTTPLSASVRISCIGHPEGEYVRGSVFFPQCGKRDASGKVVTDSPDHRSHVAAATTSGCPSTHPVKLPNIVMRVRFNVKDCIAAGCYLASDQGAAPGSTFHADFWNTWDQPTLEDMIATVLN